LKFPAAPIFLLLLLLLLWDRLLLLLLLDEIYKCVSPRGGGGGLPTYKPTSMLTVGREVNRKLESSPQRLLM